MKGKRTSFLFAVVFLTLTSTAMATTWCVNGVSGRDSNNCTTATTACRTIGHAIALASADDSIMVAASTYSENLTIGKSLRIIGSGAPTTIIDGGGVNTVVTISNSSAHVILSMLTIRNGRAKLVGHFAQGGGINNSGTLTVIKSVLSGNSASVGCFERCYSKGAGIYNSGTLAISDSTLSENSMLPGCQAGCSGFGAGIFNGGTLTISNSTLSRNSAGAGCISRLACAAEGGGIANFGTLTISNSTLSGNSVFCDGCSSSGGGISGTATIQNSIVANNSGGNCSGTATSKGYNLSSDTSCHFTGPGDMNNINPNLGPLQNNGGPTQTMALLPGSPAIDAGNPNGCTDSSGHLLKTDQRGKPRPDPEDTGGCDMGAYERQSD